ncbi:hypothetical protein UlMin_001585, partial [Ulmus minor]
EMKQDMTDEKGDQEEKNPAETEGHSGSTEIKAEKDAIAQAFVDQGITTIALIGDTGVGKTRMATQVSQSLQPETGFCMSLWLSLNKKYDKQSLHEDIARQLCVLPSTEGRDDDDEKEQKKLEESLEWKNLSKKVTEKLEAMTIHKDKNFVLLILDGVPNKMDVKAEIIDKVDGLKYLEKNNILKVLTTTREHKEDPDVMKVVVEIKPLSKNDFVKLLKTKVRAENWGYRVVVEEFEKISEKQLQFPAALAVLLAGALNNLNVESEQRSAIQKLKEAFAEAESDKSSANITKLLLRCVYQMLPSNDEALIKCCWHVKEFFSKHASIHYNELIAHWIMEGYLDCSNSVEKAYGEGHRVLMELMKRGMLKIQEDDFVSMEEIAQVVPDLRHEGFEGTAMLGLADVLHGAGEQDQEKDPPQPQQWEGFGRITVGDGMLKTHCSHKKWGKVSTLMIDGSRLCREVPETFFEPMKELQVLVIFNARLTSLEFITKVLEKGSLSKLQMLVIRGCDVLRNVDDIKELKLLNVLEISGGRSLTSIPETFFDKLTQLRSLNLSATKVEHLPPKFSDVNKIHWLVLRDCSSLKNMPSLKTFFKLQVLDLSGSSSLEEYRDKKFAPLPLRVIDFSRTPIAPLPFMNNLKQLARLSLNDCPKVTRLPMLNEVTSLQILELSGAKLFKEIRKEAFENKQNLRFLDMSGTGIFHLPSYLKSMSSLEVLNLSSTSSLPDMKEITFDSFKKLQFLDLSNTILETIPPLSNLGSLRKLFLRNCVHLKELPEMKGLEKLEVFELTQAPEVKEIPKLSASKNLQQVLLQGCEKIETLPNLGDLEKLEVVNLSGCKALKELQGQFSERIRELDLSGTKIESLPPTLSKLSNLRKLLLKDCSELKGSLQPLESLSELEELDLSGAKPLQESKADSGAMSPQESKADSGAKSLLENKADSDAKSLQESKADNSGAMSPKENKADSGAMSLQESKADSCTMSPQENKADSGAKSLQESKANNGAKSPQRIKADFLKKMKNLKTLNLSETSFQIPQFDADNLEKLSLKGCSFEQDHTLEGFSKLKILDLSGSNFTQLSSLENLSSLRELSLRGCSEIKDQLPNLEKLVLLTSLDLGGNNVKDFPYWISKLIHLETLHLPNLKEGSKIEWSRIKRLPEKLNWEECGIFKNDSFHDPSGDRVPSISLCNTEFFKYWKDSSNLKECFKKFRIYISPSKASSEDEEIYTLRYGDFKEDEINYEELYLKTIRCPIPRERFLEIRGFKEYPSGLENALLQADYISFIDDSFIKGNFLESLLREEVSKLENMKGLWLQRCVEMESIFSEKNAAKLGESFEILWLSNLPKLKSIFDGKDLPQSFMNLKEVYIDCCPMLEHIFSSSQVPKKLEKLQVKFCDNLKTLFKYSTDEQLPKFSVLDVLELPELTTIGATLPSLKPPKVRGCPNLKTTFENKLLPKEFEYVPGEEHWVKKEDPDSEAKEDPKLKKVQTF